MTYLCVDGGQTKTSVALLAENGEKLTGWTTEPLIHPAKPGALDHLREVARSVAHETGRKLHSQEIATPEAACFSLSGYLEQDGRLPEIVSEEVTRELPGLTSVRTIPDYVGNWMSATGGEPGIVLISGGGVVAYGCDGSGTCLRIGGWGHLLGDEGSGYWIGLEAIKAALNSSAGVSRKNALEGRIMDLLHTTDDREILRQVYSGTFSEADISGLAPLVVSLAEEDEAADRILEHASEHLASVACAMLNRLGQGLQVYLSGGVFSAPTMRERFERDVAASGHEVTVTVAPTELFHGLFMIARGRLDRQTPQAAHTWTAE